MNYIVTQFLGGICRAIPVAVGIYVGMFFGAKVLREKIVLHQTINIIDMLASVGDFIIKGVNGEFYPCKPDIFEKTYECV